MARRWPGFEASTWGMVMAPANLPAPLLAKLNADRVAALRRPEVVERHRTLGAEVATGSPEETRRLCEAEMEKWGRGARRPASSPSRRRRRPGGGGQPFSAWPPASVQSCIRPRERTSV